jgi:hypothetical protein
VNKVAQALHLNNGDLKKHMEQSHINITPSAQPKFIELSIQNMQDKAPSICSVQRVRDYFRNFNLGHFASLKSFENIDIFVTYAACSFF